MKVLELGGPQDISFLKNKWGWAMPGEEEVLQVDRGVAIVKSDTLRRRTNLIFPRQNVERSSSEYLPTNTQSHGVILRLSDEEKTRFRKTPWPSPPNQAQSPLCFTPEHVSPKPSAVRFLSPKETSSPLQIPALKRLSSKSASTTKTPNSSRNSADASEQSSNPASERLYTVPSKVSYMKAFHARTKLFNDRKRRIRTAYNEKMSGADIRLIQMLQDRQEKAFRKDDNKVDVVDTSEEDYRKYREEMEMCRQELRRVRDGEQQRKDEEEEEKNRKREKMERRKSQRKKSSRSESESYLTA